ncbi:unnamed protein product, partial [Hapterophycus canaliculatus]
MTKDGVGSVTPEAHVSSNDSKPVHVMELVKQHDFLSIGLGGKIHCALTKRDLPLSTIAVQQHLNSKKLKKEREWYNADFTKYEPLIVAHKTNPKLLFCNLTRIELNRIPKEVEAHVNGKRFRNRKAEMEGLKQAQRQPMMAESEEEEEEEEEDEEDEAEFWAPPGGSKLEEMDEDGESDLEGGEERQEPEEKGAGDAGVGGAEKRAPRGSKSNGSKAGKRKKGGEGKGDEPAKAAKGGQEKGGNKKGGANNKEQEGKGASRKSAARGGKSRPLSDGTPAVANAVLKDGGVPASLPSPSAKKAKNKANSPNKSKGKGGGTSEGGKSAVAAASVATTSAVKRKHKVRE